MSSNKYGEIHLYDTLTRTKKPFVPLEPGKVRMYVCGPTVYGDPHIGNFRTFTVGDIIRRWLEYRGYDVFHVMNITDIDDKTIRDSGQEGVTLKEFTERYTKSFLRGLDLMNIKRAHVYPKATEYAPLMVEFVKELVEAGYAYVETRDELRAVSAENDRLLGLFSEGHMLTQYPAPTLAEMTDKALEILSKNEKGFFLMVEGSQIDWASEDNDINYMIQEQLLFDLAIRSAIRFAMDDAETLVVVTSDHEAGGMFISEDPPNRLDGKINIQWGTDEHNGTAVPVFAYGPHAERFMGWYDNTEIPKKIADILGISNFPRKN